MIDMSEASIEQNNNQGHSTDKADILMANEPPTERFESKLEMVTE